jgi:hypothetical protein
MGQTLDRRGFLRTTAVIAATASGSIVARRTEARVPTDSTTATAIDGISRQEFFRRAPEVEGPPDRARVRKLLGIPNEIWRVELSDNSDETEIWRYGVERPNGLATLGTVEFDQQWATLTGGRVKPPPTKIISEVKLRAAMGLLHDSETYQADPLQLIRCVNALQPLGKAGVIAVFEQFSSVVDFGYSHDWLFLLMRVLFDPPHPAKPPWTIRVNPVPSSTKSRYPRYPMDIVDGVPIRVFIGSGGGTGQPASIQEELPFYRNSGKLRATKLHPPDDSFTVVDKLIDANPWDIPQTQVRDDSGGRIWGEQILRLVRTAYRPKKDGIWKRATLDQMRAEFTALGCRWSERHQLYVRGDGTFDPIPERRFEYPGAKRVR